MERVKVEVATDNQSASSSWCQAPIWNSLPHFFLPDSWEFFDIGHPLWREDGSVIYCTIAYRPCQSTHSWVQVSQDSRPYCTLSFGTPPTWRARFMHLYPPGTGWPGYSLGDWIPFSRLAGLQWRYSNSPLHGSNERVETDKSDNLYSQSRSHISTDSQSDSQSWCRAPIRDLRPIFLSPWHFL
jgi:hypothetical protein